MTEGQLKRDGKFGNSTLAAELHNVAYLNFAVSGDLGSANREATISTILRVESIYAGSGKNLDRFAELKRCSGLERPAIEIAESAGESVMLNKELTAELTNFYNLTIDRGSGKITPGGGKGLTLRL